MPDSHLHVTDALSFCLPKGGFITVGGETHASVLGKDAQRKRVPGDEQRQPE